MHVNLNHGMCMLLFINLHETDLLSFAGNKVQALLTLIRKTGHLRFSICDVRR